MIRKPNLFFVFGTTALLGACSTAPNPNLVAARQIYQSASQNPAVVHAAPLELQQAQTALQTADGLAQKDASSSEVDHFAYLAARHAEIAQQSARLEEAQSAVQNAGAARAQALLQARTQEADQARQQAAAAQQQAMAAQQQAAASREQAAVSQQQAQSAHQDAERAREGARQLQQQLADLRNNRANEGMVLTLGSDILFDVNGSQLKPGALGSIEQVANYLKQHPDRKVTIGGYTDNTGSAAYNLQLSQLRADAVRQALVQDGVPADRIITKGYGQTVPVANNDTTAGRQLNRRVQLAISGANGAAPAVANGSAPVGAGSSAEPSGDPSPTGR